MDLHGTARLSINMIQMSSFQGVRFNNFTTLLTMPILGEHNLSKTKYN